MVLLSEEFCGFDTFVSRHGEPIGQIGLYLRVLVNRMFAYDLLDHTCIISQNAG